MILYGKGTKKGGLNIILLIKKMLKQQINVFFYFKSICI